MSEIDWPPSAFSPLDDTWEWFWRWAWQGALRDALESMPSLPEYPARNHMVIFMEERTPLSELTW